MKTTLALLLLGAALLGSSNAEDTNEVIRRLQFDQNLGQQITLDAPFLDESGKQVTLGDYFGSRPVILMLGYYRCQMQCSVVAEMLARSLRTLPLEPGRDFEIVTVSIDPGETPAMALGKNETYVKAYDRLGAAAHWHCLTGPKTSIDTLARQVGFKYFRDESSGQFQHASAVHILSPTGKITRYFFADYTALDLRLALAESAQNKTGSIQDQILRLCYSYDPATGRYGFAIISLLRLGGVLTVAALAAFILLSLRREKLRKAASAGRG